MEQAVERLAIPFTFLFKRDGDAWTALACEVDIAACGATQDEARTALKDALELYVIDMFERGQRHQISRPTPLDALREFALDPAPEEPIKREDHTMLVSVYEVRRPPTVDFIPALLSQLDYATSVASLH